MKNLDTRLYFITDSTNLSLDEFLFRIEEALKSGVTMLQLREKEKITREYIDLAEKVHSIAKKYKVPLIIDDRVDVALAVDAEGVHLGQEDMPVDSARKLLGENKIIGATAKTVQKAIEAYQNGADYLGVGAIFPTKTKVKTVLTSTQTLAEICNAVPIPVNAIGGLTKNNIDILQGINISGICIVSAIMQSKNPKREVEEIIKREKELCIWK